MQDAATQLTTYRSKIEASRTAESYREQAGTREESYTVKEERTGKVRNDEAVNKEINKVIAEKKQRYADQVTACSSIK